MDARVCKQVDARRWKRLPRRHGCAQPAGGRRMGPAAGRTAGPSSPLHRTYQRPEQGPCAVASKQQPAHSRNRRFGVLRQLDLQVLQNQAGKEVRGLASESRGGWVGVPDRSQQAGCHHDQPPSSASAAAPQAGQPRPARLPPLPLPPGPARWCRRRRLRRPAPEPPGPAAAPAPAGSFPALPLPPVAARRRQGGPATPPHAAEPASPPAAAPPLAAAPPSPAAAQTPARACPALRERPVAPEGVSPRPVVHAIRWKGGEGASVDMRQGRVGQGHEALASTQKRRSGTVKQNRTVVGTAPVLPPASGVASASTGSSEASATRSSSSGAAAPPLWGVMPLPLSSAAPPLEPPSSSASESPCRPATCCGWVAETAGGRRINAGRLCIASPPTR